jgi:hypothetical protein
VDRQVDQLRGRPRLVHAFDRALTGVRAAVVDDPEHAAGGRVGLCGHDLFDQAPERLDPGLGLDAVKQVGVVDVPGGQVGQRAAAAILKLNPRGAARPGGHRRMATSERLQLGLLIGADHVLIRTQPAALEHPRVEIEYPPGLFGEGGIAREDPRARLPRLDRVIVQPAPDRRRGRVGHAALDHQPVQLSAREAPQRDAVGDRQLARERLDLGDLLRGENGAGDPRAACP